MEQSSEASGGVGGSGFDASGVSDGEQSSSLMPERRASGGLATVQGEQPDRDEKDRQKKRFTHTKKLTVMLILLMMMAAVLAIIVMSAEISVHVPLQLIVIIAIETAVITALAAWKKPLVAQNRVWHLTVIATLAGITAVAMWLGFQDVVWAVSLPAQILGAFFILVGIITFIGFFLVTARALLFAPNWVEGGMQSGSIAGAAVAGLYVTLTIVWHSFRYEPDKAWLFAILAAVCLILAIQIVPAAWQSISNFVKAAGITLVLLGSAANFWFQSVYLPENTQEGIQYAVSVNSVVKSGSGWIAMLDFTMENQSSVTAITLGTMVIVRELVFPANHAVVPSDTAQYNINNYAKDLFIKNATATWAAAPDPNIGTSGNGQPKILTIIQPIGNNSDLHPNDTVGREFDVVIPPIPPNKVVALEVQWHVLYARSTRLTLGHYYGSSPYTSSKYCRYYEQSAWFINQSALVRFTRGAQIFYSVWCTDLQYPSVYASIQASTRPFETQKVQAEIETNARHIAQ